MAIKSLIPQRPIKLDIYDKKLIFYLSQNSRIPKKELSNQLRISLPRTLYKIQRLEQEILSPAPNINFPLLGIDSYAIFAQDLSDEMCKKLLETSSCWFFDQSIGKYKYVMNVITNNIEEFCKKFLGNTHFDIYPIIRYIPDDYNPWKLDLKPNQIKNNNPIQLDSKDYKILAHISKNTTDSLLEISNATGIDRQTIKERLDKLLKSNVIQKFRYGINIFKIGFLVYILKLNVKPQEKEKILPYLRANPYSGFIFEIINGYVMYFMPPSHNELFEFTNKIQSLDNTILIDAIQTTEVFKVELVPDSVISIFEERVKKEN